MVEKTIGLAMMFWLGWFTWWMGLQIEQVNKDYEKLDHTQDRLYIRQNELCDAVSVLIGGGDVCELRDEN